MQLETALSPQGAVAWQDGDEIRDQQDNPDCQPSENFVTLGAIARDRQQAVPEYLPPMPKTIEDTGLPQQVEMFEFVRRQTHRVPPVLDARDVLENPRRMLTLLCEAVGVEFCESMLSWPVGPRGTDGIWAKHWYANVEKTTGFEPYRSKPDAVPDSLVDLYAECMEHYDALHAQRLRGPSL